MDWDSIGSLADNFLVERSKREIRLVSKCAPIVDGWIKFKGELINIPFSPRVILAIFDRKDYSDEEITEKSLLLCNKES